MTSKRRFSILMNITIFNVSLVAIFLIVLFIKIAPESIEASENNKILVQQQVVIIDHLISQYDYDNALVILEQTNFEPEEKEVKFNEITNLKNSLVKYEGEVPHFFSHSLIVYPSLAFDNDYKHEGYDMWMTTSYEFKGIIEELYKRGYILFDIRELIKTDETGQIYKNDIYLPPGKTPIIFSIDDICYYDYMKGDGFASKLFLDENGEVATVVADEQGVEQVTRDGDVVPIIDEFVKLHPDFSYKGAKGILAVTGYEGILGYRITDVEGEEYNQMILELTPIIRRLKETGWSFASHSYTHNNYFKDYSITMDEMQYDSTKWDTLIKSVVGDTNIYISPFGVKFEQDDERYRYLVENFGFQIYCNVGGTVPTKYYNDNIVMGRYAIDGLSLRRNKNLLNKFFDSDSIIDPKRNWVGI